MNDDGCACSPWGVLLLALGGFIFFIGVSTGEGGAALVSLGVVAGAVGLVLLILRAAAQPTTSSDQDSAPKAGTPSAARSQGAGKHRSPRPSGEDYEPWQAAERMQPVVGEFYRQSSYARLAKQLDLPTDGTRATIDLAVDLGLDPGNPHARHGTAITVWAEGQHVGFLADDDVPAYLEPLEQLNADGKHLTLRARLYINYDTTKRKWRPSLAIRLPRPDQILLPGDVSASGVELIPAGRVIQVTGEENHLEFLSSVVDPSGPVETIATLRTAQMGTRALYDGVQVLIDDHEVGAFSKGMGEQTHALVKLIEDAGLVPVARATVEGNSLHVEVKVRMQRSAEFSDARIQQLRELARERHANSNRRGEPFEWEDDDEVRMDRDSEARERQERNAEEGGP